jgi:hypothetical protein
LENDETARIRHFGRGLAALVHVEVAKDGGAVVAAERKVEASVGQDLVDDSQVLQDFETAGLQPFSAGSGKVGRYLIDDAEIDAATRQVTSKGQAGGPCSNDQDGRFPGVVGRL